MELTKTMYLITIVDQSRNEHIKYVDGDSQDEAVRKAYEKYSPCLVMKTEELF